jgi:hypothetical protein
MPDAAIRAKQQNVKRGYELESRRDPAIPAT